MRANQEPEIRGKGRAWRGLCCSLALSASLAATGCQIDVGGQTLPSPTYLTDDVQYFPPGPEFKLSREAAAMKQAREELAVEQR